MRSIRPKSTHHITRLPRRYDIFGGTANGKCSVTSVGQCTIGFKLQLMRSYVGYSHSAEDKVDLVSTLVTYSIPRCVEDPNDRTGHPAHHGS
jgi:hypothetical protein